MYILKDQSYFDVSTKTYSAGFATRQLGDGRNKNILEKILKGKKVVSPRQCHSNTIYEYKNGGELSPNNCDGVVTREKYVVLSVITADCLPIVFIDEIAGIIGISHQGWKGTLNRLPQEMIKKMTELGSAIQNITCIFGPAINDCCYDIFGERVLAFQNEYKSDFIFRKSEATCFLNLYKANYLSLIKSGVQKTNIHFFPFCTSCDAEHFWSYRRDNGLDGEMVSYISLK